MGNRSIEAVALAPSSSGLVLFWVGFVGLAGLRLALLAQLVSSQRVEALALAAVESLALVFGVVNVIVAKYRDYRLVGIVAPCCYAAGLYLLPPGGPLMLGARLWVLLAAVTLSTVSLIYLGRRFSIGSACWVSLCDRGPYRFVRHPQLLARLLIVASVALSGVDPGAWCALVCCACLVFLVVDVEESLLEDFNAWWHYSLRVEWKLLPGVY